MPDEISTKRKKKNVTDRMVDKTPGIQEDRIGYQIRDDINAFVDPLKQELNDYRDNVREELEIPTYAQPINPSRMDLPYQETAVDRIRAIENESPLDVAKIETRIAQTQNAGVPATTIQNSPLNPLPETGFNVTQIGDRPQEPSSVTATAPAEEPVRTASTAIKNIQDAEAAVSTARPAAASTETPAGEFDARSTMAERSRERLESQGVDTALLEQSIRDEREMLADRKRGLSAAVRRVRTLRNQGDDEAADALANEIRLERQQLESDFKQNVTNRRLLEGDRSMLTDEERAQEFEQRRQNRIDMLERNLPLQRESATQGIETARQRDANALEMYGLTEESTPAEIDRATRGVGLPASNVDTALDRMDRLNSFDIEGFVNRPITNRVDTGRDAAVSDLLSRTQGPRQEVSSRNNAPNRAKMTIDDIANSGQGVTETTALIASGAGKQAIERFKESGDEKELDSLVGAIRTMNGTNEERAAAAQQVIDDINNVDTQELTGISTDIGQVVSRGVGEASRYAAIANSQNALGGVFNTISGVAGGVEAGYNASEAIGGKKGVALRKARGILQGIIDSVY